MAKLKEILDDSAKVRRLRRIHLNIQITFLTWLVEFLGFLFVVLGSFIFGNNNIYLTFFLQMMTCFVYIVIIPTMYLLNSNDSKDHISESTFYIAINNMIRLKKNNKVGVENQKEEKNLEQQETNVDSGRNNETNS